jgi:alpha,alpha-trehalase
MINLASTESTSPGTSAEAMAQRARLLQYLEEFRPSVVKEPRGLIKYPFCIPGGFYDQQWDWDGFFIACHLAGRDPARPEYLKYWALNVLASGLPDGEVSACITPDVRPRRHDSLLLKPFLAQGAELGSRMTRDDQWLAEHYEQIRRISTRRDESHFLSEYGLFVWDDAMQSGADNNAALSNDPALRKLVAACDVNVFQYREYAALSKMAGRLCRREDEELFREKALALAAAIQRHLWVEADQSYWNLNAKTGEPIKCVTYSNFVPLWAGLASPDQGREMIRRYLWTQEHMLTPYGLRSLSAKDPDYNNQNIIVPYSNWQGPVWPIANYFYFVGLMTYGFPQEAASLVERLTRLYLSDIEFCGSLHENYDAETGHPLAPSAAQSKSGEEGGFIGWNLLLQDMIEMLGGRENLLDLAP